KTFFTVALIRALKKTGKKVMAYKPVAAGCELINGKWSNEDARAIIQVLDTQVEYQSVNPIALKSPIAPHIAAQQESVDLNVGRLQELIKLDSEAAEFILVEGAGGWLVPLNEQQTLADYATAEQLDVLLVVGLKLGCINHALLTQQVIKSSGLKLVGWVANHIDPNMLEQQANIHTLKKSLDCPLVAEIPWLTPNGRVKNQSQSLTEIACDYVRIGEFLTL
ncbi:MAG: dethiobiotin synthase, partial [Kangiellaceae bacterium]|nr:dethiobiotin synthase [Kangiellaceae bacterium]